MSHASHSVSVSVSFHGCGCLAGSIQDSVALTPYQLKQVDLEAGGFSKVPKPGWISHVSKYDM